MTLVSQLLIIANSFCSARRLSLPRVSTLIFNDGKRLGSIQRGGDLQTASFERAMVWFSANWPEGAAWPSDVPRPAPTLVESAPEVAA